VTFPVTRNSGKFSSERVLKSMVFAQNDRKTARYITDDEKQQTGTRYAIRQCFAATSMRIVESTSGLS